MFTLAPLIQTILIIFCVLHVISIVINYGMVYAFFQRRHLQTARHDAKRHVTRAAFVALGGVMALPSIISTVKFPQYGFKYPLHESMKWSQNWKISEDEAIGNAKSHREYLQRQSNRTGGRCEEIW